MTSIHAQESRKPVQGVFTTQVGFALSNSWNNINSFGMNGRYFLQDQLAGRLSIQRSGSKTSQTFYENADGTGQEGTFTNSNSNLNFMLGIEKHFTGTKHLSPYAGIELGVGFGNTKTEGDKSNGNNFVNNYSEESSRKNSSMGINAFLGFDYWITDGIYLGVEYQIISLGSNRLKDGERSVSSGGVTTKTTIPGNKTSYFNTVGATPLFRLGWRF